MVSKSLTTTPLSRLVSQGDNSQIKLTMAIIVGFWMMYYVFCLLERPINTCLARYMIMHSEYTVGEQLSKFYLFIILLISVLSYRACSEPDDIKLSISFLLLSLIIYMGESNMIAGAIQPIFGFIIVSYTGILLYRTRSWFSLVLFLMGFMSIACGVLSDFGSKKLPNVISKILSIFLEEQFESIGIALLCLCAILCFRVPLENFMVRNTKKSLLILLTSGMITVGNGFLHHQYYPHYIVHASAEVMTISGFLGLLFINKSISNKNARLKLITEDLFYLFIFFFFVLLPSIIGSARNATALLLWIPIMFLIYSHLWRYHPANNRT